MKTILIVRHAKSSWENFTVSDYERPLNERGQKNAPEMASRVLKKGVKADVLLSSPARRAHTTAKLFAVVWKMDPSRITIVTDLYNPSHEAFVNTILTAPDTAETIALFSHNPVITEFANSLSKKKIEHMPTCSVFAVKADIKLWSDFEVGNSEFFFFDTPKAK
jgi:phosphohistidine phosphatase